MENTKVSLVVAVYKSEKFLNKLLDSIIRQTYKNIEVILVDDGSPDRSGEICDEYAAKDSRFIVIHKNNGGACEARNVGLEKVTGEYVSIIDGDDWLEDDYVEYLLKLAKSEDADMSLTDKIFTTRDRAQNSNEEIEVWTAEKTAMSIIYPFIPIGPWNKLYRTELLRKNNISFSVPWSGEGLYFSFMSAQYSNKVVVGHRKIYNYRLNNTGSGLTNYNVQMGINALENIKNIKNNIIIPSKKIENACNWHIYKNYNFVLLLIVATKQETTKYKDLYKDCLKQIRKNCLSATLNSEVSLGLKLDMLLQGLFPVWHAKKDIASELKELQEDNYE